VQGRKLRKRDEQIESQKHNRRQITLKKDKKEKKDTKRLQRKKQVLVGKKERSSARRKGIYGIEKKITTMRKK
jgi:hypothetical protein